VFFWHNTTFIGLDTHTESNQIIRISASGAGTLAVRYTHYAPSDPLCCPSLAPTTIGYHWNGHAMTPNGLPPGHRAGEAATITTTPASTLGGVVAPSSVVPGASVTVTGNVPVRPSECPVPGTVILQAVGLLANGSDFVAGPYDAAGHFSLRTTLSSTISVGPQSFQIRCAGRNVPLAPAAGGEIGGPSAVATFTVVGH
jgi:hypothetical protein